MQFLIKKLDQGKKNNNGKVKKKNKKKMNAHLYINHMYDDISIIIQPTIPLSHCYTELHKMKKNKKMSIKKMLHCCCCELYIQNTIKDNKKIAFYVLVPYVVSKLPQRVRRTHFNRYF